VDGPQPSRAAQVQGAEAQTAHCRSGRRPPRAGGALTGAADGSQRAPDTNLKAVLRRALSRAGIVDGYEHRCRKPGCGQVELAHDDSNRRCPKDNRALWIRPLPKKGIVFHSLRHTTATLLARAKVHPSVAQRILRHADIETTLAIYTHLDGIEDMRAAVAKLDFGPLAERAPAPVVPLRKDPTLAANLLPAASCPKAEAPDRPGKSRKIRGLQWSGRLDLNQRPLAPQARLDHESQSAGLSNDSQCLETLHLARAMLSPEFADIRSEVNAPVMQEIGSEAACLRLLTVKQVAARLQVSTATVYALCERGALAYVRVSTHSIRIDEREVAELVRRRCVRRR
jgi:excisionase family DNA binding protein